jgi:hypothetical protein
LIAAVPFYSPPFKSGDARELWRYARERFRGKRMTNQRSMIVDVVNCVALTGRSELPWKAVPSARRPSRAARATHLPTRPARKGRLGCNRVLVNEPDPFFSDDEHGPKTTGLQQGPFVQVNRWPRIVSTVTP